MSWLRWKSPYDAQVVVVPTPDTFVPVKIDENDLYTGVLELLKNIRPNWTQEDIKLKTLTNGITNKLVSCQFLKSSDEKDIVLVRIYGQKTDLFIDRTAEIRNIKTLNLYRLAPKIYGIFENGLAYEYFPGITINKTLLYRKELWLRVASKMADMHRVELGKDVPKEPFVWDKIEQFLSLLPEPFTSEIKQARFAKSFGSVTKLRIEYERLKFHLIKTESPIVFAHNDLLLGNIIYNKKEAYGQSISFIDFEYAAYCYQAYDIANHFNEYVGLSIDDIDYKNYPSRAHQWEWVEIYLERYFEDRYRPKEDIERILKEVEQFSLVSHFLWGIWSLVQYEHSDIDFDFYRYAEIRLNRYNELKSPIFSQLST